MMTKRGKSTGAELVLCAPMDAGGRSIGASDLNDLNRPFDSRSSSHNKFADLEWKAWQVNLAQFVQPTTVEVKLCPLRHGPLLHLKRPRNKTQKAGTWISAKAPATVTVRRTNNSADSTLTLILKGQIHEHHVASQLSITQPEAWGTAGASRVLLASYKDSSNLKVKWVALCQCQQKASSGQNPTQHQMLPQLEFPSRVLGFSQTPSQNQEYRISQCQQKAGSRENPVQHQMLPQLEFPSRVLGFSQTSSQNQEYRISQCQQKASSGENPTQHQMLPQLEFPSQVLGFSQTSSQNQEYRISQCQQKSGSGENPTQHQMLPQLEFPSQVLGFSQTSSQNQEYRISQCQQKSGSGENPTQHQMLPQLEFPSQVLGFSQTSSQNQEYRISQCQQKSGSGENPAQHQMLPQLEFPSQVLGFSQTSSQNQEHRVRDSTQLQSIVSGDLPVGLKGLLRLVGQDQSPSVLTKELVGKVEKVWHELENSMADEIAAVSKMISEN
ncbi:unnamed protein product [Sphagnum troendelagicum]|uniref:Poor homologous synapsis 1 PH domain-containing protein n=1 Tax=Sphagnum troendelagicum TaxID=128251 RepID=A0ABP0UUL3_9BRYO